jgi:GT2 family glycosyltransferase
MTHPTVSIIIPTYNDWSRLSLCLQKLSNQSYSVDKYEIIVVNNSPQDSVPDKFVCPANCVILAEEKPGSYAARNKALSVAKGEIIGFTDSDCVPDLDWIKNAVDFLQSNKELSRVGGPLKIFSKYNKPSKVELYDTLFAFPQKNYVNGGIAVTGNMYTYRHIFDEVGLFDENTLSGGDYEWGLRAQAKGFNIGYAENVIVNHPARDSLKELIKKAKRVGSGQANFMEPKKGFYNWIRGLMFLYRPKTWEIKDIFTRGKHLSFLDKLWLVFLRHYLLWTSDISRKAAQKKKN